MHFFSTLKSVIPAILFFITCTAFAGDGFDNNYTGGWNNTVHLTYSNTTTGFLFGPGDNTSSGYFQDIPHGTIYDIGTIPSLFINQVEVVHRSAYLDRVSSCTFYYRIYKIGSTPPAWSLISLGQISNVPNSCLGSTTMNLWNANVSSSNLIESLGGGDYYFEFYTVSDLIDLGYDDAYQCIQEPDSLCVGNISHPGRILSSRFNTTDPCPLTYANTLATQSDPSLIQFHVLGPLPVTLASFTGQDQKSSIDLHWTSSAEADFSYYELQRSKDAIHWSTIDVEYPAFTPTGFREYHYSDEHPEEGHNYYRLKMVDLDGSSEYSPSLVIKHHYLQPLFAYPNPARSRVQIAGGYADDDPAQFLIRDVGGKIIQQGALDSDRQIQLESLPGGWYFISIYTNDSNVGTLKLYKE